MHDRTFAQCAGSCRSLFPRAHRHERRASGIRDTPSPPAIGRAGRCALSSAPGSGIAAVHGVVGHFVSLPLPLPHRICRFIPSRIGIGVSELAARRAGEVTLRPAPGGDVLCNDRLVRSDVISSLGVGFIMELIRVFATMIRWSISIPKDVYNGPASTSFQKP